MIQLEDINPDYNRLKKYEFKQYFIDEEIPISCHYVDLERVEKFNEESFEMLIKDNGLDPFFSDLYIFASYYLTRWNLTVINYSQFQNNTADPYLHYCNDLYKLNEFFKSEVTDLRINLSPSYGESLTLKSKDLLTDITDFLKQYLDNNSRKIEKVNFEARQNISKKIKSTSNPKGQSIIREFACELIQLYNYLKNETHFESKTEQATTNFVEDFINLLNIKTSYFTKEDDLIEYFRNIRKRL